MDQTTFYALQALRRRVDALNTSVSKLSAVVTNLVTPNIARKTTVAIANLVNGAANAQTLVAEWTVPVAGDYRVILQTVVAAARVGTIHASIVAGTKTATTVDVTVVNLGPSTLLAGSLDVVIHPD